MYKNYIAWMLNLWGVKGLDKTSAILKENIKQNLYFDFFVVVFKKAAVFKECLL